ncbi:MAG TPA: ABC transporter ATP-binding protein [Acidimicrobiales bacterium]|nr:ABC transporter ATP-binding protein [Acidimicrobiales bacterium]
MTAVIEQPGLAAEEVTVRFGGVVALDHCTLSAPVGRITGLIGPNGAGKSTLFNACSGLVPTTTGSVSLFGEPVDRLGPSARARRGMSRTFQKMELFSTMTVAQNVEMGREASWAGINVLRSVYRSRSGRRECEEARDGALALCGLEPLRDRLVRSLSTGQRRMVEFARVLANPARLLLLDEPSSGLDRNETAEFARVLQMAVETRGCGVLLVEHDMSLITAVCDRVHVLDFGKKICEGTVDEVLSDHLVRAAYLGVVDEELDRVAEEAGSGL